MSIKLTGSLISDPSHEDAILGGLQIEAFCKLKAEIALDGTGEGAPAPSEPTPAATAALGSVDFSRRTSAWTDSKGFWSMEIQLPAGAALADSAVTLVVSSPAGDEIARKPISIEAEAKPVVVEPIKVRLLLPIDVETSSTATAPRRLSGRVIDVKGSASAGGLQVIVYGTPEEAENDTSVPLGVARTDGAGYFSMERPLVKLRAASATISGIAERPDIALESGLLPPRLLLVLDVPRERSDNSGLDGVDSIPRAPDQWDLAQSSRTYSSDLGTGACVQFNVPNRALEEFDYYTVVRTSEPDIRGVTLPDALSTKYAALLQDLDHRVNVVLATPATPATSAGTSNVPAVHQAVPVSGDQGVAAPEHQAVPVSGNQGIPTSEHQAVPASGNQAVTVPVYRTPTTGGAAQQSPEPVIRRFAGFGGAAKAGVPSINGVPLEPAKAKALDEIARVAAIAEASVRPPGRTSLDAAHPLDWDSTPTFYEASTIALGHLLHFKQVWVADGYSLGDLLQSIPLAPGQKKIISVVDWERREGSRRIEDTLASEALTTALSRDRDVSEVVAGTLSESMRGSSSAHTWGFGTGSGGAAEGTYNAISFGGVAGVSGGYGGGTSLASQSASRSVTEQSLQQLRDKTLQSASGVRALRSTVVTTATQGETVRASTEVIANHNHCHAVTIQYFEVLRHFQVRHELADVQECLFIPLPMSEFTREKVLRWRQPLMRYLKRPALVAGFDAMQRVQANWRESDLPQQRYADEFVTSIRGELHLTIIIPLPPIPTADTEAQVEKVEEKIEKAASFLNGLLDVVTLGGSAVVRETVKGGAAIARSLAGEISPERQFDRFQQEVMPSFAAGFVNLLELSAVLENGQKVLRGLDFTLVSDYSPGKPLLVAVRGSVSGIRRREITHLVIRSTVPLPPGCRVIVNDAEFRYRAGSFEHVLGHDGRMNDDLGSFDSASLETPTDAWEERNPHKEDERLEKELRDHLNANFEYYHHAIWWAMDSSRRFMLLDGCLAPHTDRSVASVVENRLIGIVGNSLVMPVARGFRLDPRWRPAMPPKGQKAPGPEELLLDLREHYAPLTPIPPARVSLPTRGVFAESVMGSCNSCEEIDDKRMWRWDEATVDEPPEIEPASTSSRRSESASAQPSQFPTPMVAIQNAPGAPDPTGLRAISDLLGKQSFPDITGLAGNIANAGAAYKQAVDTALQYGKEASKLAQQAAVLGSLDRTMTQIDKQEKDKKISPEDARKLRLEALQKAVGSEGGQLSASDVSERLKVIGDAETSGAIEEDVKRRLSASVLRSYVGEPPENTNEREAAARILDEIPRDGVTSAQITDEGVVVLARGDHKIAPAQKTGVSSAKMPAGDEDSVPSIAAAAGKWIKTVGGGLVKWTQSPHTELGEAVARSIVESVGEEVLESLPYAKAVKLAVAMSKAFADGVGRAVDEINKEMRARYERGESAGGGNDGLSDADKAALQEVRAYLARNVEQVPVIVRRGIESVVMAALDDLTSVVAQGLKSTVRDVASQLVRHLLSAAPGHALIATALAEAQRGVAKAANKGYRSAFASVLELYLQQLQEGTWKTIVTDAARIARGDSAIEKILKVSDQGLLVGLADVLVDATLRDLAEEAAEALEGDPVQLAREHVRSLAKDLLESMPRSSWKAADVVRPTSTGGIVQLPRHVVSTIQGAPQAAEAQRVSLALQKFDQIATLIDASGAAARAIGISTREVLRRIDTHSPERTRVSESYLADIRSLLVTIHGAAEAILPAADRALFPEFPTTVTVDLLDLDALTFERIMLLELALSLSEKNPRTSYTY